MKTNLSGGRYPDRERAGARGSRFLANHAALAKLKELGISKVEFGSGARQTILLRVCTTHFPRRDATALEDLKELVPFLPSYS